MKVTQEILEQEGIQTRQSEWGVLAYYSLHSLSIVVAIVLFSELPTMQRSVCTCSTL